MISGWEAQLVFEEVRKIVAVWICVGLGICGSGIDKVPGLPGGKIRTEIDGLALTVLKGGDIGNSASGTP